MAVRPSPSKDTIPWRKHRWGRLSERFPAGGTACRRVRCRPPRCSSTIRSRRVRRTERQRDVPVLIVYATIQPPVRPRLRARTKRGWTVSRPQLRRLPPRLGRTQPSGPHLGLDDYVTRWVDADPLRTHLVDADPLRTHWRVAPGQLSRSSDSPTGAVTTCPLSRYSSDASRPVSASRASTTGRALSVLSIPSGRLTSRVTS